MTVESEAPQQPKHVLAEHPLAASIGLVASLYALLTIPPQVVRNLSQGRYDDIPAIGVVVILFCLYVWRTRPLPPRAVVAPNPFGRSPFDTTVSCRWETDDVWRVSQAIEQSPVVVIVGPSGVGKSTVIGMVAERSHYAAAGVAIPPTTPQVVERWDKCRESIRIALRSQTPRILVFDQFEQFLANAPKADYDTVAEGLSSLRIKGTRLVFVVRTDAYYAMIRFAERVGIGSGFLRQDVVGISPETAVADDLQVRLKEATKDRSAAQAVLEMLSAGGAILPLEARIVGWELAEHARETRQQITPDYFRERLGTKEDVIRSYFSRQIGRLKDRDTGMAVLFALAESGSAVYRKGLNRSSLEYVTHRNSVAIEKAVDELRDCQWIRDADYTYELAHDFIATYAREVTGSLLDPIDRDNIKHFTDRISDATITRTAPSQYSRPAEAARPPFPWRDPLFAGLTAIMLVRLFLPMPFAGLYRLDPILNLVQPSTTTSIGPLPAADLSFLPVALCVLAWMYFISQMYEQVLKHIHDDRTRWYSQALWWTSALGGALTVFGPSLFVPLMFTAGVLLGIKLVLLARIRGLLPGAQAQFQAYGLNMVGFNFFGVVASVLTLRLYMLSRPTEYFPHYGWLIVLLTAISVHFARITYVVGAAPNRWLSLVDRRSSNHEAVG